MYVCVCISVGAGSVYYTQCCDEQALMRDSYYVGLIILAVHEGDCQLRPQLFIKAMKYGPGLRRVYMCACAHGPSQPTIYSGAFVVTPVYSHFHGLQDFFFLLLLVCSLASQKTQLVSVFFFHNFYYIEHTCVYIYVYEYMYIYICT